MKAIKELKMLNDQGTMKTLLILFVVIGAVGCEPEELPEPIEMEVPEVPVPTPDGGQQQDLTS